MPIDPSSVVGDVMRRFPATIRAFLDFRLGCVGCPIACFHTVEDACREHATDLPAFLAALRRNVAAGAPAPPQASEPAPPSASA